MKLIEPYWEIIDQKPDLEGIYEQIETAGRTCYQSTRSEGQTAKDFVDRMIKSGHGAMLEHGTVYLRIPTENISDIPYFLKYDSSPYSLTFDDGCWNVTTNYRVIIEQDWLDDLKYLCEPTDSHERRVSVKFVTSIGIGRELLRHRVFSFANESTRYCNYSSEKKFNNQITYVIPSWCKTPVGIQVTGLKDGFAVPIGVDPFTESERSFYDQLKSSEETYMHLLKTGCSPQEAREVLPLATKSELIMTGFISDWKYLFGLRSSDANIDKPRTGKPHPDMVNLIDSLEEEFFKRGFIKE